MLVVLGFCHKDRDSALELVKWIAELGPYPGHKLMLSYTQRAGDGYRELQDVASGVFDEVILHRCYDEDERGWPQSCNHLWQRTVYTIAQTVKEPWLWLEPDSVPTGKGWLNAVSSKYKEAQDAGKAFMGCDVNVSWCDRHMSGIAVYPGDVGQYTSQLWALNNIAWDMFFKDDFLKSAYFTDLIQHVWWSDPEIQKQPTFSVRKDLELLDPNAVIFHRNKDLTLIPWLRERLLIMSQDRAEKAESIQDAPQSSDELPPRDQITRAVERLVMLCQKRKGFENHARAELKRLGLTYRK